LTTFEITYDIAPKGVATSFTESEIPPSYAGRFRNRYINRAGGASKREGIQQLGATVTGTPNLTGMHEWIDKIGAATLYASGAGNIYSYNGSTYTLVHSFASTGRIRSTQFGNYLMFWNGVDRNVYTKDGTTFHELIALMRSGKVTSGSNANVVKDASVTDWTAGTPVTINDLVYYPGLDAYGLVTAVSASGLATTAVSAAATGLGHSTAAVSAAERYQIIDLVELNIISDGTTDDNVAIAGTGTSTTVIAVSGVTFSGTEIRVGDFVSNTTRAAVTDVTSVSANINVSTVAGQVAGDSLVFLKSAMPISTWIHTHFGRAYHIDARDQRKVRISAIDDPQDMSSSTGTIDSITFATGSLQGKGDILLTLDSFQRYFVMAGESQVYIYAGTDPIGTTPDFEPVSLMPQGCVSADGLLNIGNALLFVSRDGIQAIMQSQSETQLQREGLTGQINETLRDELDNAAAADIQLFHYRQRSWVILKVGSQFHVINYASMQEDSTALFGAMSLTDFDGKFCRQNAYLARRNDDLVCAGGGGKVYIFDKGDYADDGEVYSTEYQTGWLTMGGARKDGRERPDVNQKKLLYMKPLFEAGAAITYSIRAEGGYDAESTDTASVPVSGGTQAVGLATIPFTIGGSSVINTKLPLRTNGEVHRITVSTQDDLGPDTLGRYTLYVSRSGFR